MRKPLLIFLILLFAPIAMSAGHRNTDIEVKDLRGKTVRPLTHKDRTATVFLFITNDCPISNTYAPEMSRIYQKYREKKVALYLIYVDPAVKSETAAKHNREFRLTMPALLDPAHKLVKLAGATVTPEAAVFGPDSTLVYRGRINDLYLDFGKRRYEPTIHDLRQVLDALVTGKRTALKKTKAIGCFIPGVKQPG